MLIYIVKIIINKLNIFMNIFLNVVIVLINGLEIILEYF